MRNILILILAFLLCTNVRADSFLTSTIFHDAYRNKKIIKEAKNEKLLNEKLISYILKKKNPIAIKLAIINKLGWDFDRKKLNAEIFLNYLVKHNLFMDVNDITKNADEEVVICYAYMLAMGDYFNVREAKLIASIAKIKDRKNKKSSYAINLICSLIDAQNEAAKDRYCRAYKHCDDVRNNMSLKNDFNKKARKKVFEYVDVYKKYCED